MLQKLYAVCDLAMGLVLTKTTNVVLKDFPAEPVLPAKLFTRPDQVAYNLLGLIVHTYAWGTHLCNISLFCIVLV